MMKRRKKLLSLLLALCMALSLLPITALAAETTVQVTVDSGGRIVTDAGENYPDGVTINSDENYELAGEKQYAFSGSPVIRTVYNGGTILSGNFTTVYNLGTIVDGTFHSDSGGTVDNSGTITGGTFKGAVTNRTGGTITGGTFEAGILNYGGTVQNLTSGYANVGNLGLTTNVLGNGSITISQRGVTIPRNAGKAGETYNLGFDSTLPIGLYLLTGNETAPSENFTITDEFETENLFGTTLYKFTMPDEAVTILAVFSDYDPNGSAATYSVTVNGSNNGTVAADKTTAAQGDTVTLTVTPADGYELNLLSVMNGSSNVSTTDIGNGKHTFTMPAGNVTVSATFSPKSTEPATGYDLWVGGTEVTSDKLSDAGWSYDPTAKTLTLTNATINRGMSSIASAGDLNIVLVGTNNLNKGIMVGDQETGFYKLTISGTGSMTVTTSNPNGAIMAGSITLNDGLQITQPGGGWLHTGNGIAYIVDSDGVAATSVTLESSTLADIIAPRLSFGTAERIYAARATVSFTSDEAGTYYYLVANEGDSPPLNAVMLIQAAAAQGKTGSCINAINTISLTGLSDGEAKVIYIAVRDAAKNTSNMLRITIPAATYIVTYTDGVAGEEIFADVVYRLAAGETVPTYVPPERAGFLFDGWSPNYTATVTKNTVFTAKWREHLTDGFTVTYTDGVIGEEIFADVVYTDLSQGDTTPAFEGTPTRSGYTFAGWAPKVTDTVTGDTVYTAQWTRNSGGYFPVFPLQPANPVTLSGDETSIEIGVTVQGDKATVDKIDFSALHSVIGNHVETGVVVIDFSKSQGSVDTVELPANVVKQIADAANDPSNDADSLKIVYSNGSSVTFDAKALGGKSAQAGGSDVTIALRNAASRDLNAAQQQAIGSRPAVDIHITSGGSAISDFGGKMKIQVPYTLQPNEKARGLVAFYVDENGNKTRCDTGFDSQNNLVYWTTDHNSVYMIGYDETEITSPKTGDSILLPLLVLCLSLGCFTLLMAPKRTRK